MSKTCTLEFDLARIDERLLSLGIDPALIDKSESEISTLDLSGKIEKLFQTDQA
jgi:hypothetical protein